MLLRIAKWAIADQLNSPRVVLLGVLLLLLFPAVTVVRTINYTVDSQEFADRKRAQEQSLRKYAHVSRLEAMAEPIIPPGALSVLVEPAGNPAGGQVETLEEDLLNRFVPSIDVTVLSAFLLPLLILLVSQADANRARSGGTLQLMVALPFPRTAIPIGRILGTTIIGISVLCLGLAISAGFAAVSPRVSWGAAECLCTGMIGVVAVPGILFAASVGQAIGTFIRSSEVATAVALGGWLLLEVITPAVAPLTVHAIHGVPPTGQIHEQIDQLLSVEREARLREILRPYRGLPEAEAWERSGADQVNQDYFSRASRLRASLRERVLLHRKLIMIASSIAPGSSARVAMRELAGVGLSRAQHVRSLVASWRKIAEHYVKAKVESARRENPLFSTNDWLDVSNGPRFVCSEEPLLSRIEATLPYLLYLCAVAILAALGAALGFLASRHLSR